MTRYIDAELIEKYISREEHNTPDEKWRAEYPEEAVAIVEKWAAEHPQKTIFQDFLEKYPNASLTSYGTPHICPCDLGYEEKKPEICFSRLCIDCWNRPIEG